MTAIYVAGWLAARRSLIHSCRRIAAAGVVAPPPPHRPTNPAPEDRHFDEPVSESVLARMSLKSIAARCPATRCRGAWICSHSPSPLLAHADRAAAMCILRRYFAGLLLSSSTLQIRPDGRVTVQHKSDGIGGMISCQSCEPRATTQLLAASVWRGRAFDDEDDDVQQQQAAASVAPTL